MVELVIGPNDINGPGSIVVLNQFCDTESKRLGQLYRGCQCRVGRLAFDLADHRTADTTGPGQRFQRPVALAPQYPQALRKMRVDGIGDFLHLERFSCILDFHHSV